MIPEMEKKVEAVKQLKSKYYATSWEAWNYLKAQEDHSKLAQIISKDLHESGIDYSPSANEISNLCSFTGRIIWFVFEAESRHKVNETKMSFDVHHIVFPYSRALKRTDEPSENQDELSKKDDEEADKWGLFEGTPWRGKDNPPETKKWSFDYRKFLVNYFKILRQTDRQRDDYQDTFRATMLEFMNGSYPYLKDEEGNKFSFTQLKEKDFLVSSSVHHHLEDHLEDIDMDLSYKIFWDWINGHGEVPIVAGEFNNISSRNAEESIFLFGMRDGRNIYKRAEREQTLRRMDIQRRIALSHVVDYMRNYNLEDVDIIIEWLDRDRKDVKKRPVLQFMAERKRELLKYLNYVFMAVKINKKWIKEVLKEEF
jgi:hypothetical protein